MPLRCTTVVRLPDGTGLAHVYGTTGRVRPITDGSREPGWYVQADGASDGPSGPHRTEQAAAASLLETATKALMASTAGRHGMDACRAAIIRARHDVEVARSNLDRTGTTKGDRTKEAVFTKEEG